MAASKKSTSNTDAPRRRRLLLTAVLLAAALWFTFFDSHSLIRRARWHQEYQQLTRENDTLRQEIATLEARLAEPVTDEIIEQIAREQYGMRRPGETVYRVEEQ